MFLQTMCCFDFSCVKKTIKKTSFLRIVFKNKDKITRKTMELLIKNDFNIASAIIMFRQISLNENTKKKKNLEVIERRNDATSEAHFLFPQTLLVLRCVCIRMILHNEYTYTFRFPPKMSQMYFFQIRQKNALKTKIKLFFIICNAISASVWLSFQYMYIYKRTWKNNLRDQYLDRKQQQQRGLWMTWKIQTYLHLASTTPFTCHFLVGTTLNVYLMMQFISRYICVRHLQPKPKI